MPVITMEVEVESIDQIVRDELMWHYTECDETYNDDELKAALAVVLRYYGEEV